MKKEIEHVYYWNKTKNPRIIQFKDSSLALYTPEAVLSQFVQREKRIPFYPNGQIKQFTFQDGYTEEYDENGRLIRSYTAHQFSDLKMTQCYVCEYTYNKRGKIELAEGIIESIDSAGKTEVLDRTILDPQYCPNHAKVSEAHLNEIIQFLQKIPHTGKNLRRIQFNYTKNYAHDKDFQKRIRYLIEHEIPVMIRA